MKEHLESRGLQFHRYDVTYDDETAVFKIYTPTGIPVGYQQYRPAAGKDRKNDPKQGRYYTHMTKGYLPIWGFETLDYGTGAIFLCEGVWKSVRLHRFELTSLAVLGNDPRKSMSQLKLLGRKLIAICDGDDAGKKLAKFGDDVYFMQDKHLDDMTDNEVFEFLKGVNI